MNRPGTLTFICYFSVMYGFYCLLSLFIPYGNGFGIIDLTHYLLANIESPKTLLIFFNMLILPLLYIIIGLGLVNGNNWARWVFIIGSIAHFIDMFMSMGLNIYPFDLRELLFLSERYFPPHYIYLFLSCSLYGAFTNFSLDQLPFILSNLIKPTSKENYT